MIFDHSDVVGHVEAIGFALLSSHVANVYLGGIGGADATAYALNQEVAKGVSGEPSAGVFGEAVLEQLGNQRLGVRESGDAVANVAGRKNAKLAAKDAGATAVVGDRDDGSEIAAVLLEATQQRGEA